MKIKMFELSILFMTVFYFCSNILNYLKIVIKMVSIFIRLYFCNFQNMSKYSIFSKTLSLTWYKCMNILPLFFFRVILNCETWAEKFPHKDLRSNDMLSLSSVVRREHRSPLYNITWIQPPYALHFSTTFFFLCYRNLFCFCIDLSIYYLLSLPKFTYNK